MDTDRQSTVNPNVIDICMHDWGDAWSEAGVQHSDASISDGIGFPLHNYALMVVVLVGNDDHMMLTN